MACRTAAGSEQSICSCFLLRSSGLIPRACGALKIEVSQKYPAWAKRKSSLSEGACPGEFYFANVIDLGITMWYLIIMLMAAMIWFFSCATSNLNANVLYQRYRQHLFTRAQSNVNFGLSPSFFPLSHLVVFFLFVKNIFCSKRNKGTRSNLHDSSGLVYFFPGITATPVPWPA